MTISLGTWIALTAAIVCETIGTTLLNASEQFTRPIPTVACLACYGVSFWLLSVALKTVPVGIAYAIWSGVGIVLISLMGRFVFGQVLDAAALVGIGLIAAGVVVINLFSSSSVH